MTLRLLDGGVRLAWQLVKEVLDGAPAFLGPTERLVLVALAEWSDAQERTCWRTSAEICARVGVSENGLRKVFQRLAGYGIDPRLPIQFLADGSPVYAYKGRATAFRLPYVSAAKAGTEVPPLNPVAPVDNSSTAGTPVPPLESSKAVLQGAKAVLEYLKGGTGVPPSPSETKETNLSRAGDDPNYPQAAS